MTSLSGLEIRSRANAGGTLEVFLEHATVPEPAADEIVIRIEAAAINPSDIGLLLGPADLATLQAGGTAECPLLTAIIPAERLGAVRARMDQALPVGNEGAGVVVKAGADLRHWLGRTVAALGKGMYAQYRVLKAEDCLLLPEGTDARDGASAFVNPLTALGMVETMKAEGHTALVHTAAASNVGQMLNRVCLADGVGLVNIVRNSAQRDLLRSQGAVHVLDSNEPDFYPELVAAITATGATLAFDAIGGGSQAATILLAMEESLATKAGGYSRYGSIVHKQVYIYGGLNPGPKVIQGNFGMAWGVGGWLMTSCYAKLVPDVARRARERVAAELKTTFATDYTAQVSLAGALSPAAINGYSRRATGEKYMILPHAPVTDDPILFLRPKRARDR